MSLTRRLADRFGRLTNLADARLGARVLFASDEWFAVGSNLLQPTLPHWDSETFCTQGKVMDGWESRRRRKAGHDWAVIRLGLPGYVLGVEIDTAHFTGNSAPAARVMAATIAADASDSWLGEPRADLDVRGSASTPEEMAAAEAACASAAEWVELVPATPLRGGYVEQNDALIDGAGSIHRFIVPPAAAGKRVTHLRLDQLPDGGIARLRAWGVVHRDFESEMAFAAVGRLNLLSEELGARAVGATDTHYGERLHPALAPQAQGAHSAPRSCSACVPRRRAAQPSQERAWRADGLWVGDRAPAGPSPRHRKRPRHGARRPF